MSSVEKVIPAYPFVQYNDDGNIVAFFDAYNTIAQSYLDSFNALLLPCWTSSMISSYLLDWVALGVYGQTRPSIILDSAKAKIGVYNTVDYNSIPYAKLKSISGIQSAMPDDIFKRLLTWNFYKGDGFQFSIPWLKRRVSRFVHGENGTDPHMASTFDVTITVSDGIFLIGVPDYGDGVADFLVSCIEQGYAKLPFMYSFSATKKESFESAS